MSSPFLQSVLLGACPELRESWEDERRSAADAGRELDDAALLDTVRRHVVTLLLAGRVAEFGRFARAIERLLGEADPMLHTLLLDDLLRPLADDVRGAEVPVARVAPYLGPRLAVVWPVPGH